jgi:hypothetical protein
LKSAQTASTTSGSMPTGSPRRRYRPNRCGSR